MLRIKYPNSALRMRTSEYSCHSDAIRRFGLYFMNLVDSLIEEGWLKTPRIIEAFRKIKRVNFLPKEIKDLAELNEALPIG